MKIKEMTNESLAAVLRAIAVSGIKADGNATQYEQEYLQEAADRLEYIEDNNGSKR